MNSTVLVIKNVFRNNFLILESLDETRFSIDLQNRTSSNMQIANYCIRFKMNEQSCNGIDCSFNHAHKLQK